MFQSPSKFLARAIESSTIYDTAIIRFIFVAFDIRASQSKYISIEIQSICLDVCKNFKMLERLHSFCYEPLAEGFTNPNNERTYFSWEFLLRINKMLCFFFWQLIESEIDVDRRLKYIIGNFYRNFCFKMISFHSLVPVLLSNIW